MPTASLAGVAGGGGLTWVKRLFLIASVAVPFFANAAGLYGIRTSQRSGAEQAFSFRVAVEPLLDAEWWATVAVSCRLRPQEWLTAVEVSIDDQAAIAANSIWKANSGPVGQNIKSFILAQEDFHVRAADAPQSECGALRSAGELEELDQMARADGTSGRGRSLRNWAATNAPG